VQVTSTPGADARYVSGERIQVTVTTSFPVTLTGGSPSLALTIGGSTRAASLKSGSGTTSLEFEYTVGFQDADTDGLSIGPDALALGGATAKDGAGRDVALSVPAVSHNASHRVQGERPRGARLAPNGRGRRRTSSSTASLPRPSPQEPRGSRSARTWTPRQRATPRAPPCL